MVRPRAAGGPSRPAGARPAPTNARPAPTNARPAPSMTFVQPPTRVSFCFPGRGAFPAWPAQSCGPLARHRLLYIPGGPRGSRAAPLVRAVGQLRGIPVYVGGRRSAPGAGTGYPTEAPASRHSISFSSRWCRWSFRRTSASMTFVQPPTRVSFCFPGRGAFPAWPAQSCGPLARHRLLYIPGGPRGSRAAPLVRAVGQLRGIPVYVGGRRSAPGAGTGYPTEAPASRHSISFSSRWCRWSFRRTSA